MFRTLVLLVCLAPIAARASSWTFMSTTDGCIPAGVVTPAVMIQHLQGEGYLITTKVFHDTPGNTLRGRVVVLTGAPLSYFFFQSPLDCMNIQQKAIQSGMTDPTDLH